MHEFIVLAGFMAVIIPNVAIDNHSFPTYDTIPQENKPKDQPNDGFHPYHTHIMTPELLHIR